MQQEPLGEEAQSNTIKNRMSLVDTIIGALYWPAVPASMLAMKYAGDNGSQEGVALAFGSFMVLGCAGGLAFVTYGRDYVHNFAAKQAAEENKFFAELHANGQSNLAKKIIERERPWYSKLLD